MHLSVIVEVGSIKSKIFQNTLTQKTTKACKSQHPLQNIYHAKNMIYVRCTCNSFVKLTFLKNCLQDNFRIKVSSINLSLLWSETLK